MPTSWTPRAGWSRIPISRWCCARPISRRCRRSRRRSPRQVRPPQRSGRTEIATSLDGRQVLAAHAAIAPLNWQVFVETPLAEAFAPLYTNLLWNAGLLLLGLAIAVLASLFLARNLVGPIRALAGGRHPDRPGRSDEPHRRQDRRRAAVARRALQSDGRAAPGILRQSRRQGRGADPPAGALGQRARGARRGQPGDQLDPRPASGARDSHPRPCLPARRFRRRRDLRRTTRRAGQFDLEAGYHGMGEDLVAAVRAHADPHGRRRWSASVPSAARRSRSRIWPARRRHPLFDLHSARPACARCWPCRSCSRRR